MVVLISTGFQEVDTTVFRKKSLSKGKKLVESSHVSKVCEELREDGLRRLKGRVLRETPGAASEKNNTNYYYVFIEVDRLDL